MMRARDNERARTATVLERRAPPKYRGSPATQAEKSRRAAEKRQRQAARQAMGMRP